MEEEVYTAEMDAETVNQDFDDVDFYGERIIDDDDEECDIQFE